MKVAWFWTGVQFYKNNTFLLCVVYRQWYGVHKLFQICSHLHLTQQVGNVYMIPTLQTNKLTKKSRLGNIHPVSYQQSWN